MSALHRITADESVDTSTFKPVAVFEAQPLQISAMDPTESEDDLGRLQLAMFKVSDGPVLYFRRYLDEPPRTFTLLMDARRAAGREKAVLLLAGSALQAFRVEPKSILWTASPEEFQFQLGPYETAGAQGAASRF